MSKKLKPKQKSSKACNLILTVLSLVWVFPVLFALIGSMKTKQMYNLTSFWELPTAISWGTNLEFIAKYSNILQSVLNSLFYAFCGALGCLIIASFAAYGLTKLKIKFRMFWFMVIYSGTIFPFQMYLIPVFKAYLKIGLYDTRIGLIIFYIAICVPFAMFVMRNHFLNISNEIIESAIIDGASDSRVFFSIMLPMSKASLAVVALTQFSWCYNELMFGITFVNNNAIKPVMATLSTFTNNTPAMLTACFIVSIPTIALYLLLNKNFDTGIAYTSK
ncbi:MAG: carbohydrate ABC transporter permease [Clostridia bacterium]|nr:carbohydrate ABC transporter permease [Clostridia bacterium]